MEVSAEFTGQFFLCGHVLRLGGDERVNGKGREGKEL